MTHVSSIRSSTAILVMAVSAQVVAAPAETPPAFIKRIADQIISQLAKNKKQLADGLVATQIVTQHIDPHIDGQSFSRLVLGEYYPNTTAEQRVKFTVNFRKTLIRKYASGLSQYSSEGYTLKPYRPSSAPYPIVAIDFKDRNGGKIPISFQLVDRKDEWKIRNINVNGVDLALMFRDQFKSTVQEQGGNIDKAIVRFSPDADVVVEK